ncbi:myophilin-like [Biomphalaria glabrata]|uniref:Transgelin n=1 Tax=Biomphalaria glabrata TaxID=6526 RepID=A0A9W3B695_BIOGL|nr:myophilin-like [Biomphalaria glabrata]
MATRPRGYGLTGEVNRKIASKYDLELEQRARLWIEAVLEEQISDEDRSQSLGMDRFQAALKDGTILCKLINKIKPGVMTKKMNTSKMPFLQMENISNFLEACEKLGVSKTDLFQTVDLYDKINMVQVVNCIYALGRKAPKVGYNGPSLGVKEADENPRNFSPETLNAGQSVIGLQMGTNKGANQSGMNFGRSRSINEHGLNGNI